MMKTKMMKMAWKRKVGEQDDYETIEEEAVKGDEQAIENDDEKVYDGERDHEDGEQVILGEIEDYKDIDIEDVEIQGDYKSINEEVVQDEEQAEIQDYDEQGLDEERDIEAEENEAHEDFNEKCVEECGKQDFGVEEIGKKDYEDEEQVELDESEDYHDISDEEVMDIEIGEREDYESIEEEVVQDEEREEYNTLVKQPHHTNTEISMTDLISMHSYANVTLCTTLKGGMADSHNSVRQ